MSTQPPSRPDDPPISPGRHLATVSHGGRFWDVYVEFEDDGRRADSYRGRLCFSPADPEDEQDPVRTRVILIESSYEETVAKARSFEEHHLTALLRSCLPG